MQTMISLVYKYIYGNTQIQKQFPLSILSLLTTQLTLL